LGGALGHGVHVVLEVTVHALDTLNPMGHAEHGMQKASAYAEHGMK